LDTKWINVLIFMWTSYFIQQWFKWSTSNIIILGKNISNWTKNFTKNRLFSFALWRIFFCNIIPFFNIVNLIINLLECSFTFSSWCYNTRKNTEWGNRTAKMKTTKYDHYSCVKSRISCRMTIDERKIIRQKKRSCDREIKMKIHVGTTPRST
jgi:hypothetical protein